jgi:hypothetical protein
MITNEQEFALLAKMLPEKLETKPGWDCLFWIDPQPCGGQMVRETELLNICHQIEEGLTEGEWNLYIKHVEKKWREEAKQITYFDSVRFIVHMTWRQRTEALAIVKGVL